ncbi:hypothetical protein EDB83DRAFT_2517600 [Lactarius deliciosus]|nr:hypothetical protein EDB83DRAFT_2517600 [Lactarius deliciosus]
MTHQEPQDVLSSTLKSVLNYVEGLQAIDGSITEVIECVEFGHRHSHRSYLLNNIKDVCHNDAIVKVRLFISRISKGRSRHSQPTDHISFLIPPYCGGLSLGFSPPSSVSPQTLPNVFRPGLEAALAKSGPVEAPAISVSTTANLKTIAPATIPPQKPKRPLTVNMHTRYGQRHRRRQFDHVRTLYEKYIELDAWNLRTRSRRRHGLRQFDHVQTLYEKYI